VHYAERVLLRVFSLLLIGLFVVETAGVARAFGRGSLTQCCCGAHATARPCHCRSCPAKRHRRAPEGPARLGADGGCHESLVVDGTMVPLALRVAPPSLPMPARAEVRFVAAPLVVLGHVEESLRPPP